MKKIMFILAAAVAAVSCGTGLTVLHVNDTHSHLEPVHDGRAGIIERAAFTDSVRVADGKHNVLVLHAGDFNQGSSYFTILKGKLEAQLVNAMGYDCICLGNHEFDNGIEDLMERLNTLNCEVVCANYDFTPFPGGDKIKPYAIFHKGGYKIGVVGLLTDLSSVVTKTTADRLPHLGDDAEILTRWATYLKEERNCDMVIGLTHIGYEEDKDLAARTRNVDYIVGGHSHTVIKAPAHVSDLDGKDVTIVTDGSWGYEVGVLKIK